MNNVSYLVLFAYIVLFFCGCAPTTLSEKEKKIAELCQTEIQFAGKPTADVPTFFNTELKKYNISGGVPNSYSGTGVKNSIFCPDECPGGTHYIYYRDNKNKKGKKIKIRIIALATSPENCNCDDDYRVKCNLCNQNGEIIEERVCSTCKGTGLVRCWYWFGKEDCKKCNNGRIRTRQICSECDGKKWKDCDKH